jgi:thiosulfate dehydrogenase
MMYRKVIGLLIIVALGMSLYFMLSSPGSQKTQRPANVATGEPEWPWEAPDSNTIPQTETGDLVRYGRALISHTASYLGPHGTVVQVSNGMNCQNCHLDAGTKPWGNNYGGVSSTYPKYRDRSGTVESIEKKINDCIERSLNGQSIDSNSREMKAMVAYMHWLGTNVAKGKKPLGAGLTTPAYLDRAADPVQGRQVFVEHCQRCHGANGQGQKDTITGTEYMYPPLWGPHSFNIGAGIYRLSKMAGYVMDNMPFGISHGNSVLSEEQAWDVAAFINSQPHPFKDLRYDWPDISSKPVDHPFGPYTDTFSEQQHKFGPFGPIEQYRKTKKNK